MILLVGAGLFVRSFSEIQRTELGFEPNGLALMEIVLPLPAYPQIPEQIAFFDALQERVASLPGVVTASGSSQPPGTESLMTFSFGIEGRVARNASGREDDDVLLDRQALHARRLKLAHPETGAPLEFIAPLADDLQRVLEELRAWRTT